MNQLYCLVRNNFVSNQSRTRISFLLLQLQVFKNVCHGIYSHEYVHGWAHASSCMGRPEDNLKELVFFFISILGMELRWSGLIESAFTFWTVSPVPYIILRNWEVKLADLWYLPHLKTWIFNCKCSLTCLLSLVYPFCGFSYPIFIFSSQTVSIWLIQRPAEITRGPVYQKNCIKLG